MSDNQDRFTSTNDVGRALYAELDAEVEKRAKRKAERAAFRIQVISLGLIDLSEARVAELAESYRHQLYAAVFESEAGRMRRILDRQECI